MKLTDLRQELTARAAESDEHAADLLLGVRRKVAQTKRRRAVGALASMSIVAALAVGVLPGLTTTSAPDPAVIPKSDYVENGVTLPGQLGADLLDKGAIGTVGQNRLEVGWTPTTTQTSLYTVCSSSAVGTHSARIEFNGHHVTDQACDSTENRPDPARSTVLQPDSSVWLDAPIGKPARVTVTLVDEQGRQVSDPTAQLALGFYRYGGRKVTGPPSQTPPTSPSDYVKDGVRYRSKIGGDSLIAAVVGDPGESSVKVRFSATGAAIGLRDFCTTTSGGTQYEFAISLNGRPRASGGCRSSSTDAGGGGRLVIADDSDGIKPGQLVEVTIRLQDKAHRPVSPPGVRLGLGIYQPGSQRRIDGLTSLDEIREHQGYVYRLSDLRTVDARSNRQLEIPTPAEVPFLLAYGSTDLGSQQVAVTLTDLPAQDASLSGGTGGLGIGIEGKAARSAGTARLSITQGKPTRGKLILAIYTRQ